MYFDVNLDGWLTDAFSTAYGWLFDGFFFGFWLFPRQSHVHLLCTGLFPSPCTVPWLTQVPLQAAVADRPPPRLTGFTDLRVKGLHHPDQLRPWHDPIHFREKMSGAFPSTCLKLRLTGS